MYNPPRPLSFGGGGHSGGRSLCGSTGRWQMRAGGSRRRKREEPKEDLVNEKVVRGDGDGKEKKHGGQD
eukprot:759375-Hanusia_phi.AAC.1